MALTISFKGKRVLVTGASRGLGHDLVVSLYAQGAIIFALAGNPENLAKLKMEFPDITTLCADLSDWNTTRKVVEEIGPVDCLVNNAGTGLRVPFLNVTEENFDRFLKFLIKCDFRQLEGCFQCEPNCSQIVAKAMIAEGRGGSIVNVSSILGQRIAHTPISLYSVSKAGLDMLTKNMAVELGPHNIRVNTVSPGVFESDMTKDLLAHFPNGGPDYQRRCPAKKIVNIAEIVNTILFLLSDAAPMINAENLVIDGGYIVT